jgi:hypothetical protein
MGRAEAFRKLLDLEGVSEEGLDAWAEGLPPSIPDLRLKELSHRITLALLATAQASMVSLCVVCALLYETDAGVACHFFCSQQGGKWIEFVIVFWRGGQEAQPPPPTSNPHLSFAERKLVEFPRGEIRR